MRRIAAIALLMLVPSLGQAQVSASTVCGADADEVAAWAQSVSSQSEYDAVIEALQNCAGVSDFKINLLLRVAHVNAGSSINTGRSAVQVPFDTAVQNQLNNNAPSNNPPRETSSASS